MRSMRRALYRARRTGQEPGAKASASLTPERYEGGHGGEEEPPDEWLEVRVRLTGDVQEERHGFCTSCKSHATAAGDGGAPQWRYAQKSFGSGSSAFSRSAPMTFFCHSRIIGTSSVLFVATAARMCRAASTDPSIFSSRA